MIYRDQTSSPSRWFVPKTRHLVSDSSGPATPRGPEQPDGGRRKPRWLEVRGPAMADAIILSAVAVFLAGVVAGIVVIVSIGIRREERDFLRTGLVSMTRRAPGRASDGARSLTSLYVGRRTDPDPAPERYED